MIFIIYVHFFFLLSLSIDEVNSRNVMYDWWILSTKSAQTHAYIPAFDRNLLWNKWMRIYLRRRVRNFGNKHSSMNFQFSSKALCLPGRTKSFIFLLSPFLKRESYFRSHVSCIHMTRSRREAEEHAHFFFLGSHNFAKRNVCVSTAAEDQLSELKSKMSLYIV